MAGNPIPKRLQLYYLCQLAGWGGYGLFVSAFSYYFRNPHFISGNELLANFILCFFALLLTHGFRALILRRQWMAMPLPKLTAAVAGSSLLMSALFVALAARISLWLGPNPDALIAEDLILLIINYLMLFLFWSGIYFSIAFFRRYRQEEIQRLKWESGLKEFELNKLKSQLNPHFVFNALNGIRSLVEEEPAKSKQAITQLSNILRNSLLSDRAQTISLAEEMKTVLDYLQLEKIRFEERLQFSINTDAESTTFLVPPMMIQTLVENAVKHGISSQVKGGEILLSASLQTQGLEIRIDNPGRLGNTESDGFGILNTRQRLGLIYGNAASFQIEQSGPETVTARLFIPKTTK